MGIDTVQDTFALLYLFPENNTFGYDKESFIS